MNHNTSYRLTKIILIAAATQGLWACGITNDDIGKSGVQQIIGEDNRTTDNTEWIRGRVGALLKDGSHHCTAFATGPRTITTAYHCIENQPEMLLQVKTDESASRKVDLSRFSFKVANRTTGVAKVRSVLRDSDIAVLEIAEPNTSWFELGSYTRRPISQIISVNGDDTGCITNSARVFETNRMGVFAHALDSIPGASGSPILQNDRVIGIHIGALRNFNLAVAVQGTAHLADIESLIVKENDYDGDGKDDSFPSRPTEPTTEPQDPQLPNWEPIERPGGNGSNGSRPGHTGSPNPCQEANGECKGQKIPYSPREQAAYREGADLYTNGSKTVSDRYSPSYPENMINNLAAKAAGRQSGPERDIAVAVFEGYASTYLSDYRETQVEVRNSEVVKSENGGFGGEFGLNLGFISFGVHGEIRPKVIKGEIYVSGTCKNSGWGNSESTKNYCGCLYSKKDAAAPFTSGDIRALIGKYRGVEPTKEQTDQIAASVSDLADLERQLLAPLLQLTVLN